MNNKFKIATLFLATIGYASLPVPPASPAIHTVTVYIEAYKGEDVIGSGSGALIASGDEYTAVTAKHVLNLDPKNNNKDITYKVSTYLEKNLEVTSTKLSKTHDVALIKFKSKKDYKPAIISKQLPKPMTRVYSSGFPLGMFMLTTDGIVNYSIANTWKDLWTCTAPASPGNSGGGVYDAETRELIGISVMLGSIPTPIGRIPIAHMHMFIPVVHIATFIGSEV